MNLRQLRKQDKRAAALLIGAGEGPDDFAMSDDGRYVWWYRSSYEYDEWDYKPALEEWEGRRAWEHPNACAWYGFNEKTGENIPVADRPRGMTRREAAAFFRLVPPLGFRWRGRRVVPVGVMGEMIALRRRTRHARAQGGGNVQE